MIWLAMGLILVGATLQTSAYALSHLIIGRVITGFGTGIDSSTVPMYQSELSKKEWRGRLVSWEIWFIGKHHFSEGVGVSLTRKMQESESHWPIGSTTDSPMSLVVLHGAHPLPSSLSSQSWSSS